jgi:hypothetical protein
MNYDKDVKNKTKISGGIKRELQSPRQMKSFISI